MRHPGLAGGRLFPVLVLAESFNGNTKAGMDARQMQARVYELEEKQNEG